MPKSKLVVEEGDTGAGASKTAKAQKTYNFNKGIGYDEVIDLGSFGTIQFNRTPKPNGEYPTCAAYTTTDAKLAEALRNYAKENPGCMIFENQ